MQKQQQQQQPGRKSLIPSSTLTPSVTHHRILSSVCPQSARLPSRLRPSGWAVTAGLPFPTPTAHSCLMISLVIQRSRLHGHLLIQSVPTTTVALVHDAAHSE